jgi:hypothetical protein
MFLNGLFTAESAGEENRIKPGITRKKKNLSLFFEIKKPLRASCKAEGRITFHDTTL